MEQHAPWAGQARTDIQKTASSEQRKHRVQSTRHTHHAPARIGGEGNHADHADRTNDEAAQDAAIRVLQRAVRRTLAQAHEEEDQHHEERGEAGMEEPGNTPERVLGGGVDAGVECWVKQVASQDGASANKDENLRRAAAREAQEGVWCAKCGHAHIVAAKPHNRRMILPEPRDRFRGRLPKRWVAIDFETTGIWSKEPDVAVIEVGLITYEGDHEVAAWSTLVKSGTAVSDFIAELTGITQLMVDTDGVNADDAGDALAERLAGAELVIAHNMAFDINGLDWLGIELGRDQHTFCTMKGLTAPDQKWPRLEEVVAEFHIKVEGQAHRAESDARTAGRVFIEMVRRGY